MTVEYNDDNTAYVSLPDLPKSKILIDVKNVNIIKDQKFSNSLHTPPRWYWSNAQKQIYTLDTNKNRQYFFDIVLGKKIHEQLEFIGKHGKNHYDFRICSVKEKPTTLKFINDCEVVNKYGSTIPVKGNSKGEEKNIVYIVRAKGGEIRYYMHCSPDVYVRVDEHKIENIKLLNNKPVTWFIFNKRPVCDYYVSSGVRRRTHLHSYLMNNIGGHVDEIEFINGDSYDFRISNLKLKTTDLNKVVQAKKSDEPDKKQIEDKTDVDKDDNQFNKKYIPNYFKNDVPASIQQSDEPKKTKVYVSNETEQSKTSTEAKVDFEVINGFKVIKRYDGVIQKMGTDANKEKNPIFECVVPNEENRFYMHCKNNDTHRFTLIDKDNINKLQYGPNGMPITWYYHEDKTDKEKRYMVGSFDIKYYGYAHLYMHQYLMEHYGHGKGQMSINHINWDKLDNRIINLELADQSTQNKERGKVSRHHNAKELPDGVGELVDGKRQLPIYVEYGKFTTHTGSVREYFVINKPHPILEKCGYKCLKTSTSTKISIQQKYAQINEMIERINKGLHPKPKI